MSLFGYQILVKKIILCIIEELTGLDICITFNLHDGHDLICFLTVLFESRVNIPKPAITDTVSVL